MVERINTTKDKTLKTHLDYLRLATWDLASYPLLMSSLMEKWPGNWEQGSWLQYKGWRKEQIFIGRGFQNKRHHAVCQASGVQAEKMKSGFLELEKWYCTRLDVQMTIPSPDINLDRIHKSLGAKKTTLISSEKNKTLYLGSRTSDIFTRLYEKPLNEMYLRLEFEIKGQSAKSAWVALQAGTLVSQIFAYYLGRSKLPIVVKRHYDNAGANDTDLHLVAETLHNAERKLKWLQSIDNAVMLAITDPDIGVRVQTLVMSWANYAGNLDKMDDVN